MKVLIVLALVAAVSAVNPANDEQWQQFKKDYNKEYSSEQEEMVRYRYFAQNIDFIQAHNSDENNNFTLGINQFGDLSDNEFTAYYLGYMQLREDEPRPEPVLYKSTVEELPATVDWRTKGYVTPIKNQGACGSCWAFSATGSLEGQHFKKTGKLVSLSEQNLVDCSEKEGNHGCGGGLMDFAFKYVEKNHGIDTEASYPYKAKNEKCKYSAEHIGATCTGKHDITRGSEKDLQEAVAQIGPISVGIDASSRAFRFYEKGVFNYKKCSSTRLDHGVLAVGYGTLEGDAYWLVKNSWGKTWGDEGYIMMSRNKDNQCGIATAACYPLV